MPSAKATAIVKQPVRLGWLSRPCVLVSHRAFPASKSEDSGASG